MKRKVMLCGVVLILGLLALGCEDNPTGGTGLYYGTVWTSTMGNHIQTITFTSDSAFTITDNQNSSMNVSGTYIVDGNTITLTMPGETATGTINGNSMTIGDQTYTKQGGY